MRITANNIHRWPAYEKLLNDGKIKFDKTGRLRYLHGAPVGDMILTGLQKSGKQVYRESAEEWFDPESARAVAFVWPE